MEPDKGYPKLLGYLDQVSYNDSYLQFLPNLQNLISLISNGELPENLIKIKDHFLKTCLPTFFKNLITKRDISFEEKNQLAGFLSESFLSMINGYCNGVNEFIFSLENGMNYPSNLFYPISNSNFTKIDYNAILKYLVDNGALALLINSLEEETKMAETDAQNDKKENQLNLDSKQLQSLISVIIQFYFFMDNDGELIKTCNQQIDSCFSSYLELYKKYKNIFRDADPLKIVEQVRLTIIRTHSKKTISNVLDFSIFCLKCEYLDKNKVGLDNIKNVVLKASKKFLIKDWAIKNNIIDFFTTTTFHDEIMILMSKQMPSLFMRASPSDDQIIKLLYRTCQDTNQKELLIQFLALVIITQDPLSESLITRIFERENIPNQIKSQLAYYLINLAKQKHNQAMEFKFANYYINYSDLTEEVIDKFINYISPDLVDELISKYIDNIIYVMAEPNQIKILPALFDKTYKLESLISKEFIEAIVVNLQLNLEDNVHNMEENQTIPEPPLSTPHNTNDINDQDSEDSDTPVKSKVETKPIKTAKSQTESQHKKEEKCISLDETSVKNLFTLLYLSIEIISYVFTKDEISVLWNYKSDFMLSSLSHCILDRGVDCFSPEAIDYLSDLLSKITSNEYSTKLIYFIYIFILSLSNQKNIIDLQAGKSIVYYDSIETLDIPHFDLLVKCITTSSDTEPANSAIEYIISILCKCKVSQQDIVHLISSITYPIITDKNSSQEILRRALQLIHNYLRRRDANVVLSDYGIQKHKNKIPKDWIQLTIEFAKSDRPPLQLWVDRFSKIENLKRRIGIIMNVTYRGVILKKQNRTLFNPNVINSLNINTPIICTISDNPQFHKDYSVENLATYQFYISNLTSMLLNLLLTRENDLGPYENKDDLSPLRLCKNILNYLPTDQGILLQIQNKLGQLLEQSKDHILYQKYVFQTISMISHKISNELWSHPEYKLIWNDLKSGKIPPKNKSAATQIFYYSIPINDDGKIDIEFLLRAMTDNSNKKFRTMILNIFQQCFVKEQEKSLSLLLENAQTIRECFKHYSKQIIKSFMQLSLRYFDNEYRSKLYDELLPILDCLDTTNTPNEILHFIHILIQPKSTTDKILEICSKYISKNMFLNGISVILCTIFHLHPEIISSHINIIESIIPKFIGLCGKGESEDLNDLYNIIRVAIENDTTALEFVSKSLQGCFSFDFDSWDYNVKRDMKTLENHTGLTNLGCTCYMNSVIQQLFACQDYRNMIISAKHSEHEWLNAIKEIFTRLLLTSRSSASTRAFCNTFLLNEVDPINIREQQDASEFYLTLVDQLNSNGISSDDFKISLHTCFKGVDETFSKDMIEDSFMLTVPLKNISKLEDFINIFTEGETRDDYYAESLQKKIKIQTITHINKAPKILVFQLARFSYNFVNRTKSKLDNYFEFPDYIDIQKIMIDKSSQRYRLKGVIIHMGIADAGHYFSLIKENGNKWIEYNDNLVKHISYEDFRTYSFGGQEDETSFGSQSAYLLFYEKIEEQSANETNTDNLESEKEINHNKSSIEFDPTLYNEIETDNELIKKIQTAFSHQMLLIMQNIKDIKLLLDYMLHVLIHSTDNDDQLNSQIFNNISQIVKEQNKEDEVADYITNNKELFSKALLSSMPNLLMSHYTMFLQYITYSTPSHSIHFINYFVDVIATSNQSYKQATNVANVISVILNHQEKFQKECISTDLYNRLLKNITVFISKLSDFALKSFDLANLIDGLSSYITKLDQNLIKEFFKYFSHLIQNHSTSLSFCKFLIAFNNSSDENAPKFPISKVIKLIFDYFLNNPVFEDIILNIFSVCETESNIKDVLTACEKNVPNDRKYIIAQILEKNIELNSVKSILLEYPFIIPHLLQNPALRTRIYTEKLFYSLFSTIIPPDFETFADKATVEQYYINDSDSDDSDSPFDAPNYQQAQAYPSTPTKPSQTKYADGFVKDNMLKFINVFISAMPDINKRTKEAIQRTTQKQRKYTHLIRIIFWIMTATNTFDKTLINLLFELIKIEFYKKQENKVILQFFICFFMLPSNQIVEYNENIMELSNLVFSINNPSEIDSAVFFYYIKCIQYYIKENTDKFIEILNDQDFNSFFQNSLIYHTQENLKDFLEFLNSSRTEIPEIAVNINKFIHENNESILNSFDHSSNPDVCKLLYSLNPEENSELYLEIVYSNFVDMYNGSFEDPNMQDVIDKIIQILNDNENETNLPTCFKTYDLDPSNETIIQKGFPLISFLCTKYKDFLDFYMDKLFSKFDVNYSFPVSFMQLVMILDKIPNERHCQVAVTQLIKNSQYTFPDLSNIPIQTIFNVIKNASLRNDMLQQLISTLLQSYDSQDNYAKDIILFSVKLALKRKNGKNLILGPAIHDAFSNKNSIEKEFVEIIVIIIQKYPKLKNFIIDSIDLTDDQLNYWPEDCLVYIEYFIKDSNDNQEEEEISDLENSEAFSTSSSSSSINIAVKKPKLISNNLLEEEDYDEEEEEEEHWSD